MSRASAVKADIDRPIRPRLHCSAGAILLAKRAAYLRPKAQGLVRESSSEGYPGKKKGSQEPALPGCALVSGVARRRRVADLISRLTSGRSGSFLAQADHFPGKTPLFLDSVESGSKTGVLQHGKWIGASDGNGCRKGRRLLLPPPRLRSFRYMREKVLLIDAFTGHGGIDPDRPPAIIERMEAGLQGLSPETRRQYLSVARRFDDFAWDFWQSDDPDYEQLTGAIRLWFEEQNLHSPSTIATYRSALSRYASAAGFEIDLSRLVPAPRRSAANTARIKPLDDVGLARIRRESSASPVVRLAIELALAGLSLRETVRVRAEDLSDRGLQVGMVLLDDGTEVEIFDPISVRWIDEHKGLLPLESRIAEERLRHRIAGLIWRHGRLRGGTRCLKITGVRRALAMGVNQKRLADSLRQKPGREWGTFRRHKSRQPDNFYDPMPADPARAREVAEMSDDEFEKFLENIGIDDPE